MSDKDDTPQQPLNGGLALYSNLQKTADWFGEPDDNLRNFAYFANQARAGFGITLFTAAGTIAGTIIAGETFFEGLAALQRGGIQDSADATTREVTESMARMNFDSPANRYRELRENSDEEDDEAALNREELTSYIHLQDAVVFQGHTRHDAGFMRVQLSHVVAWTLGGPPRD
ncbi:hypothetical protein [Gordonia polyisoprenivorans]|uniref:hypothetical protein n=1 Tax=Gordonia polyisoprenivorans TaxID=84595 RepID=UPI001AD6A91F|nr:hypothetical protein [Gordonia polyisoprenivorans]QTI69187.1 hypothetical protein J6U32_00630 [Gordonia polyisoprenivorans]